MTRWPTRRRVDPSFLDLARQLERPWSAVLVDCFGTLLHRRVPARRVQELAADELALVAGVPVDAAGLLARWRRLERELSKSPNTAEDADVPRDVPAPELAAHLHGELMGDDMLPRDEFVDAFCDILVAAEVAATRPDVHLVKLLDQLPDSVRRVVLSDTGLIEPMMSALLRAHGLAQLFDVVVVSSAYGRTKRSGALYTVAVDELGVDPSLALMIGDNESSDGRRAEEAGMRSALVPGGRWDAVKDAGDAELRRDVERSLDEVMRDDGRAVFPELALTLWLFVDRLDAALRSQGASRAVFLAREGRFLRELYERYDRDRVHTGRPPLATSYLMVSRKSAAADDGEGGAMLRELVHSAAPESGPLHLVDVGWKGTVRDRIAEIEPERAVHAHLLGLILRDGSTASDLKHGHLFANRPRRTPFYQVFSHFKGLFELVLAADHGSVASYRRGDDGAVEPVLQDDPDERRCHEALVGPLQAATAARFAEVDAVLRVVRGEPSWLVEAVARRHARMMYRPTVRELDFVDGLVQYDNFGEAGLKVAGEAPAGGRPAGGLRRHVSGGGWPPLRMRRAGAGWQRRPYGWVKAAQLHAGRLR